MQQQGTISRSDYNVWWKVDFIWQPASWLDWEEAPKHFPKPNLHPKMVIVIVWWSAAHLINYSFLNPSKAITSEKYAQQINEMHWKLQCLQLALVNRKGSILNSPTACCTTNTSKVGWIGLQNFASSSVFTWPLANWISLFQASRQILPGNHFTTNRRQKKLSKSMPNPKAQIFML